MFHNNVQSVLNSLRACAHGMIQTITDEKDARLGSRLPVVGTLVPSKLWC